MTKRDAKRKATQDSLVRFSISMPDSLLGELDQRVSGTSRQNRSDLIRALVRRYIAEERWKGDEGEIYGTLTLLYDHHLPNVTRRLTDTQHDHGEVILCSTHVHMDHDTCLECIILKGDSSKIQKFIEALGRIRGIKSLDTVILSGV